MLAIVDWTSFQALEVMAVETWAKILWAKLEYTGIGSVGVLWLLFSARFSNQDEMDYQEDPRIAVGNTDTYRPDGLHQRVALASVEQYHAGGAGRYRFPDLSSRTLVLGRCFLFVRDPLRRLLPAYSVNR